MSEFIRPDWPAPAKVQAVSTTRVGGVSLPPYESFNLAEHVGDDINAVNANRLSLRQQLELPAEPHWLQQVHEASLVEAGGAMSKADASWSTTPGQVCAVMTADCLPVLMCDRAANRVSACHAGWRGLHAGVIQAALSGFDDVTQVMVWLGPAIGPRAFEVGVEVYQAFTQQLPVHAGAFTQKDGDHWLCDIYQLARHVLEAAGVTSIYGGADCTFEQADRYFSYRRDGSTGRMASLIWLSD